MTLDHNAMIPRIQQQEAREFLNTKRLQLEFGDTHPLYMKALGRWASIVDLMAVLGIDQDMDLPEVAEAIRIMQLMD